MERDDRLELYGLLAARLKQAHTRVAGLQVTDEVRVQLSRRLLVITAAAKHDLPAAARRLDALMTDLEEGRLPDEGSP
jgi:hypothetical protein